MAPVRFLANLHGVHDYSRNVGGQAGPPLRRYEQGDWAEAMKTAFESSPDASVDRWRSPVLFIHGDDDRNVRFEQTTDLVRRLAAAGVPYEELIFPNEVHGFMRHDTWIKADGATVHFFEEKLGTPAPR